MSLLGTGIPGTIDNASNLLKESFGLGAGFNPLDILTGIPGLSTSSSATSSASGYQFNNYNAPFNVGCGSLKSDATASQSATPISPSQGAVVTLPGGALGGVDMGQVAILLGAGFLAWMIIRK